MKSENEGFPVSHTGDDEFYHLAHRRMLDKRSNMKQKVRNQRARLLKWCADKLAGIIHSHGYLNRIFHYTIQPKSFRRGHKKFDIKYINYQTGGGF